MDSLINDNVRVTRQRVKRGALTTDGDSELESEPKSKKSCSKVSKAPDVSKDDSDLERTTESEQKNKRGRAKIQKMELDLSEQSLKAIDSKINKISV
jgi:hypothetical protein